MADAEDYNPLAGMLPVPEAAKALRVSDKTVYRMITEGHIAGMKHAGKTWIEMTEITDYFARQRAKASKARDARAKAARSLKAALAAI